MEMHADIIGRYDNFLPVLQHINLWLQFLQDRLFQLDQPSQLYYFIFVVLGHLLQLFLILGSDLR